MIIPKEKIEIPLEKIRDYLLQPKIKNDKSQFLKRLGYSIENPSELVNDIAELASHNPATLQKMTSFGTMYEVTGNLRNFGVVTIWLVAIASDKFRFITLFPRDKKT